MLSKQCRNSTNSVLKPNIDSDESLLAKPSEVKEIGRGDPSEHHNIPHIQSEIEVGSAADTTIEEELQLQDNWKRGSIWTPWHPSYPIRNWSRKCWRNQNKRRIPTARHPLHFVKNSNGMERCKRPQCWSPNYGEYLLSQFSITMPHKHCSILFPTTLVAENMAQIVCTQKQLDFVWCVN